LVTVFVVTDELNDGNLL